MNNTSDSNVKDKESHQSLDLDPGMIRKYIAEAKRRQRNGEVFYEVLKEIYPKMLEL